jgi:hypothetical protein
MMGGQFWWEEPATGEDQKTAIPSVRRLLLVVRDSTAPGAGAADVNVNQPSTIF